MDARRIWTLYETFKGRKVAERIQQINEETHRIKGMYMTNVDFCVKIQCVMLYFVNYFQNIKNTYTFTLHIYLNIIIYHQFTQEAIIIHFCE